MSFDEFTFLITNQIKQQKYYKISLTRLDEAKQKIEAGHKCYKVFKEPFQRDTAIYYCEI